jgi:hypothetical protein
MLAGRDDRLDGSLRTPPTQEKCGNLEWVPFDDYANDANVSATGAPRHT